MLNFYEQRHGDAEPAFSVCGGAESHRGNHGSRLSYRKRNRENDKPESEREVGVDKGRVVFPARESTWFRACVTV